MPRKLASPMVAGPTVKDVRETSVLMIDSPSDTSVPLPTLHRCGESHRCATPKLYAS